MLLISPTDLLELMMEEDRQHTTEFWRAAADARADGLEEPWRTLRSPDTEEIDNPLGFLDD